MPAEKGKVVSVSHRYRPASEYDDATLAQKREYWRNKKREQRARLSEQGKKQAQDNPGEELPHLYVPADVNPLLSDPFAVFSPSIRSDHEPCVSAPQRGGTLAHSSLEVAGDQKQRWLQTAKVSKVSPHSAAASQSITAEAAERNTDALTFPTKSCVCKAAFSISSGSRLSTSSPVPPSMNSGSSTETTPQPCVKLKTESKAEVGVSGDVSTDTHVLSPCGHVSFKKEDGSADATPQSGANSASVTTQKAEGAAGTRAPLESEDERAARRREQWRIKKREQRAKVAARIAKYIERMPAGEVASQRPTAQEPGLVASSPQSLLRGGQMQCPHGVKSPRQTDRLQNGKAIVAAGLHTDQMKAQPLHGSRIMQTFEVTSIKKLPSYTHYNVTRGIARCKTPRQRLIEAQKNIMNQRNLRCKSPSMASVFSTRGVPRIDPNDTPEQIIAKRREYWRLKKREQRAKLSMEMKARLKEKDSLMRRVKRYQEILEDMRRARVLAHPTGSAVAHASEPIGGFIKEDGTLTVDSPQSSKVHDQAADSSEDVLAILSKNTAITETVRQMITKRRGFASVRKRPPPPHPAQVRASFPLALHPIKPSRGRPHPQVAGRPHPHLQTTNSPSSVGLRLTHPLPPQSAPSAGSNWGGCVMKMAVSTGAPSLDSGMTEEERMAKKREYWRIKKREQRAARAVRLKQGVLQARISAGLQRRRAQRQQPPAAVQLSRGATGETGAAQILHSNTVSHANEIKQEAESVPAFDLNSQPEEAICPDIKPPAFPPAPPAAQPETDPSASADSQATTLLAVASMRKLLEESLSTFTECKNEQTDIKTETVEDPPEQDVKPSLHNPVSENFDKTPIAVDLKVQMKNCPSDLLEQNHTPELQLRSPLQNTEPFPPGSCSSEVVRSACGGSSQTPSGSSANISMEVSGGPASACTTHRLSTNKACCSPELSQLHPISAGSLDPLQLQRGELQHGEQRGELQHGEQRGELQHGEQQHGEQQHGEQRGELQLGEQRGELQRGELQHGEQRGELQRGELQRGELQHGEQQHGELQHGEQRGELQHGELQRGELQHGELQRGEQQHGEQQHGEQQHGEQQHGEQQHGEQQHGELQHQTQKQWQDGKLPSAAKACWVTEQSSFSSLQKKREYWKLMKRQQRARLKARQKERRGDGGSRSVQAPGLKGASPSKAVLLSRPPVPSATGAQKSCKAEQPPEPPGSSTEEDNINAGPPLNITNFARVCESLQEWSLKSTIVDSVSSLPTLSPPENPLASINLQPIESPGQSPTSSLSPVTIACARLHGPENTLPSPRFAPLSSMVPPKPIPGESEEGFLMRKREYWRIKKKEQRARKAIQEKGGPSQRPPNNWRPVQPVHGSGTQAGGPDSAAQDSGQWVDSPADPEQLTSISADSHPAPFTFPEYTAQAEDELELLFSDHEGHPEEEGPLSDVVWRNRYLMDYDPLNQLLVCMVCGELQYSHGLEGVRAHIDEAHSHTLALEPREKQRILEAWDEQVSQRERFFTSQLQQRSQALEDADRK